MVKLFISKFEIHPVLWVVMGAGLITGYFWEVLMVFLIVIVHECGHAAGAYYFKWRIHKIKLLPFGGVAEVDEYGNRPFKEELIVLIGGPLQHIWLPLLSVILLYFNFWTIEDHTMFLEKNQMILFFNLLPIWPLDGGKLVRLIMTRFIPFKRAHMMSLGISIVFLVMFSTLGFLTMPYNPNFWVIIAFILTTHFKEWKQHQFVFIRFLLERWKGESKNTMYLKSIFVTPDMLISDVVAMFYKGFLHRIIIKSNDRRESIDESALLDYYFKGNGGMHAINEIFR